MYESGVEEGEKLGAENDNGRENGEEGGAGKVNGLSVPEGVVGEADRKAVCWTESFPRGARIILHGAVYQGLGGNGVEAMRDVNTVKVGQSTHRGSLGVGISGKDDASKSFLLLKKSNHCLGGRRVGQVTAERVAVLVEAVKGEERAVAPLCLGHLGKAEERE